MMTDGAWRIRCAAILEAARSEGFEISDFTRSAVVLDPHGRHHGLRFEAMVPACKTETRIEDVQIPLTRGDWMPPTELCDPRNVARRKILEHVVSHDGNPEAQTAVLVAAFVYSHMTSENRRRYAWPIPASAALVHLAVGHLASVGTVMTLPASGTYALIGTAHMCRSAPEPLCDTPDKLDRSVGRHIALSFRDSRLLSIRIAKGGEPARAGKAPETRSLLALDTEDLRTLLSHGGIEGVCLQYSMKPRDVQMICRRRGITVSQAA